MFGHQNPGFGTGSGSGSALNQCGSTTLGNSHCWLALAVTVLCINWWFNASGRYGYISGTSTSRNDVRHTYGSRGGMKKTYLWLERRDSRQPASSGLSMACLWVRGEPTTRERMRRVSTLKPITQQAKIHTPSTTLMFAFENDLSCNRRQI